MENKSFNTDEFIRKRKRKKFIKKLIIFFILLCSILVTLCLKLSYFNIQNINVQGNKNITSNDIINISRVNLGDNIFYTNSKTVEENVLLNPYIEEVKIKKVIPNKINIIVKEREATFYTKVGKKYLIISQNGCVLEKRNNISKMEVTELEGFNFNSLDVGEKLKTNEDRKLKILEEIGELLNRNNSNIKFNKIDLKNILDIKIYHGNICIKLGTSGDIEKKVNTAINILKKDEFKNSKKGYIDVSYQGNPVFFIEK
ncbi:cell division protein FtsQ/DivIB [Clostridium niameyense]|uniref:cell division protein FtsQ/DivIB n=1 Tax=Clostridium niameyense TaxID=1622073 RepID=UPI00067EC32B|nr:FtsQ-type POTRA domain-containing protein [Clostridium niameyense]